jgi:ATP-dependent DNA helicase RecG
MPAEEFLPAHAGVADIPGVSNKEAAGLAATGLASAADLLELPPRRYEDRRRFDAFPLQAAGAAVCLRGTVVDSVQRRLGGGRGFYEAVIEDAGGGVFSSGKITCRWFNMPFISKALAAGQQVVLYGKPKEHNGRLVIDHPEFEVVRDHAGDSIHLERIVPIYRALGGVSPRRLREILHTLLARVDPATLAPAYDVDPSYPRAEALRELHFPDSLEHAEAARRRFALEAFFAIQLRVAWRRQRHADQLGRVLGRRTTLLKAFYQNLPFDLTGAQKRSIREIIDDMRSPRPMHRLLQGDVGSGKTFVALCAMLLAVDSGCQAALMAPTQILAEQHYLTFKKWLEPLGVRIALRTGSRREANDLELAGEPQIIIGTHALLFDSGDFRDLGLVVIDEQHKFGVAQRAGLIRQGITPDVLVMTATPIPRTLTMTLYGDLDVSLLDELPAGRGKIVTGIRTAAKVSDVTAFVKEQLNAGRQAYLVYPLVEESEGVKAAAATAEHARWAKRLARHQVGLLHGKLSADEKESVMTRFRAGEIDVLVATTVIEVGVDVPNANLMVIHHAERFGLAQLHQLRGRIGRGAHKSYCILLTDGKNPEALEKLRVLEQSTDGFRIAEEDLRLRGPGDVLGTAQSGLVDARYAEFLGDVQLIREARALADDLIRADPHLERHPALRQLVASEPTGDARG